MADTDEGEDFDAPDHDDDQKTSQLLNRLNAYGDSLLDEKDYQARKKKALKVKKKRTKDQEEDHNITGVTGNKPSLRMKKKMKKKRKEKLVSESGLSEHIDNTSDDSNPRTKGDKKKLTGEQKHLQELKDKLGLSEEAIADIKQKKQTEQNEFLGGNNIEYRLINGKKRPPPEVVVFEDPSKRKKKKIAAPLNLPTKAAGAERVPRIQETDGLEFNLKHARHDVLKLGIKGMEKQRKEEAQIALAVKLGAKPPKRKCVNYKEFQIQRKQEKQDSLAKRAVDRQLGYKVPKADRGVKRNRSDISFVDGQIGKYKGGVQMLTTKEIDHVNNKKRRR